MTRASSHAGSTSPTTGGRPKSTSAAMYSSPTSAARAPAPSPALGRLGQAPPRLRDVTTGPGHEALHARHLRHEGPRLIGQPDRLHRRASQLTLRLVRLTGDGQRLGQGQPGRRTADGRGAVERGADQRGRLARAARREGDQSGVVAGDREQGR